MPKLRFEQRALLDPLSTQLVDAYLDEISGSITGFDPAIAAPPESGEFDPPSGAFLVAFEGDVAIGCGGLRRLGPGVGEIRRMWIAPAARGRGHARALLEELEATARDAGYGIVRLDTHGSLVGALALYRGSGYREIERYNDNHFAEHFFEKSL